jgi:hypothetical protein
VLVAATRRFAVFLGLVAGATVIAGLVYAGLAGVGVGRAVSVALYLAGSGLVLVGFFLGLRGPIRIELLDHKGIGRRQLRIASREERSTSINDSVIIAVVGLVLVGLGVAADSRYPLF